jgi:hypothetical protein
VTAEGRGTGKRSEGTGGRVKGGLGGAGGKDEKKE